MQVVVAAANAQAAGTAMASIPASTYQAAITNRIAAVPALNTISSSISVASITLPSSSGYNGYEKCYTAATCIIDTYAKDTHYKVYKMTPSYPAQDCADACTAEPECEAFESLSHGVGPSCYFWMNGACDIMADNPPGFTTTGVSPVLFCDKDGDRKEFEPGASKCHHSRTLGRSLIILSVFLWLQ